MYDSGVECTITPHSSSNQIFVVVDMSVGLNNGYGGRMILRRDSTDLINFRGTPTGTRPIVTKAFNDHKSVSAESYSYYNIPIHALDQPNTTSAVTYKITAQVTSGHDLRTNYNQTSGDDSTVHGELTGYGSRATMILMEISG